jgi:hypothetical protein
VLVYQGLLAVWGGTSLQKTLLIYVLH